MKRGWVVRRDPQLAASVKAGAETPPTARIHESPSSPGEAPVNFGWMVRRKSTMSALMFGVKQLILPLRRQVLQHLPPPAYARALPLLELCLVGESTVKGEKAVNRGRPDFVKQLIRTLRRQVLEHLPPPAYVRALPLLERIILMGASADLAVPNHFPHRTTFAASLVANLVLPCSRCLGVRLCSCPAGLCLIVLDCSRLFSIVLDRIRESASSPRTHHPHGCLCGPCGTEPRSTHDQF